MWRLTSSRMGNHLPTLFSRPPGPLLAWGEPPQVAKEGRATLAYSDLVRYGLAIASAGAGLAHLTAAPAHTEHALVFAFFVGVGVLQLLWAGAVAARRPSDRMLDAGGLGNAAVIGVWVVSRVTGLPFIEGADHAEPIAVKDTVATLLEVLVVAGVLLLTTWKRSRPDLLRARLPAHALAPLALATVVLAVPGVVLPAPNHADHGRGHTDEASHLAAGHQPELGAGAHGHTTLAGAGAHGTHAADPTHVAAAHAHATAPAPPAAAAPPPVQEVDGLVASVRYGPFVMPPASLGGTRHVNKLLTNVPKPCTDCFILAARPNLVYDDGSPANLDTGPMLHHAVWTRPSFRDTTCGRSSAIGSQGLRFFASGNERTELRLPSGFGYPVGADPWNLIVEIMNHSEQAKTVYVTLDVTYRPASDGLRKVTPVWLDVDNCGDSEYAIPAGKSVQTWTWTSTITGRVVSTGGHVHDGGVKTVMTNETTTQSMCTSVAGYGKKAEFMGSVESMSICVWDRLGVVRAGEDLGIHAYYDSNVPQDDVMGIMLAFVYETSDLDGGSPPPDSSAPSEPDPPPVHEH